MAKKYDQFTSSQKYKSHFTNYEGENLLISAPKG